MGLHADGDTMVAVAAQLRIDNVVDRDWVAVDWTLSRAIRTTRFWWIAAGFFCGI